MGGSGPHRGSPLRTGSKHPDFLGLRPTPPEASLLGVTSLPQLHGPPPTPSFPAAQRPRRRRHEGQRGRGVSKARASDLRPRGSRRTNAGVRGEGEESRSPRGPQGTRGALAGIEDGRVAGPSAGVGGRPAAHAGPGSRAGLGPAPRAGRGADRCRRAGFPLVAEPRRRRPLARPLRRQGS